MDQVRNGTHVVHIFEAMEIKIKDSRNGYGKEGNMFGSGAYPALRRSMWSSIGGIPVYP